MPSFKVTLFFDAEYLINSTTMNESGLTHALLDSVISNDLE